MTTTGIRFVHVHEPKVDFAAVKEARQRGILTPNIIVSSA